MVTVSANASKIGARIRETRLKKGLTQKQLGDLCGMADSAIRRSESGRAQPKLKTLEIIADALQVTLSELAYGINIKLEKDSAIEHTLRELANIKFVSYPFPETEISELKEDRIITNFDEWYTQVFRGVAHTCPLIIQVLISHLHTLNAIGKQEAIKRVSELTEIKKYTDPDKETKADPDHKE